MNENAECKISTEFDGRKRRLFKKICLFCGVEFWIPKHKYERRYCSRECCGQGKITKQEIQCYNCGKTYKAAKSRIGKSKNNKHGFNFCSRLCKEDAQKLDGICPEIRPDHYGTGSGFRKLMLKEISEGCISCGINKEYLLQVHHIDGNRKNNKRENFIILFLKNLLTL